MELSNKTFESWISRISGNENLAGITNGSYNNDLFGITFSIPKDWHIVSINQFDNLFRDQLLVGEYEHYKEEIFQSLHQPSLVVSKYDPNSEKYHGLVSPVIIFSIVSKEPEYKGISLKDYADLIEKQTEYSYSMLKKFKVTGKGEVLSTSGFGSIIYDTEYLFEHAEMDEGIMVEMSVFNVDYGDFFLDFSMTQCQTQGQIAKPEFEKVINSIKLVL